MSEEGLVQDSQLQARWAKFFTDYEEDRIKALAMQYPEKCSLIVDFSDLELCDPDLADLVLLRPTHAFRVGAHALFQIDVPVEPRPRLHLRVTNLPKSVRHTPRSLRVEHQGRFVSIEGTINRVTEVDPILQEGAFECKFCGNVELVFQDDEHITEPAACNACEKTGPWRLLEEESRSLDHQRVEIQESPEGSQAVEAEHLECYFRNDLVQTVRPGDRAILHGILKTKALRGKGGQKLIEFRKLLMVNSVEVQETTYADIEISPEEESRIQELAGRSDAMDLLVASFGPTISGHERVKQSILLALFGGVGREVAGDWIRGDIHVLMCGDPGLAKSSLLKAVQAVAPRVVVASGRGASAAGLTAAAIKDDFGRGRWTFQAGALVLADKGVACLDELDKMRPEDRGSMNDAMEQQRVALNKAGINMTLPTRAPVIGAANPKFGRFDDYESPVEQIDLEPALRSRFDFIWTLVDKPRPEADLKIAKHMARVRRVGIDEEGALPAEFVRKWIAFSKRIEPRLTEEVEDWLTDAFVKIRAAGAASGSVALTFRQAGMLFRVAEAAARLHLRPETTMEDARLALQLMQDSLVDIGAVDASGLPSIDHIEAPAPRDQHERMQTVMDIVRVLTKESHRGWAEHADVLKEAGKRGLNKEQTVRDLKVLLRNTSLYQKGGGGTYTPLGADSS